MTKHITKNISNSLIFAASAALLSACATPAPPPPPPPIFEAPAPVVVIMPEPLPAPKPRLTIPQRSVDERLQDPLVRAAAGHASLMQTMSLVSAVPISTADDLNRNMDSLTAVFSPRLGPGMMSYGALVAAQNSQFTDSVIAEAEAVGVEGVVYKLYSDPNYASAFAGAPSAAMDINAAWAADKSMIASAGAAVKQQSYDLQKDPAWKKQRTDDRKARIASIQSAGRTRPMAGTTVMRGIAQAGAIRSDDFDAGAKRAEFWRAFGRSGAPNAYNPSTQMGPRVKKALTLAALETLGAAGQPSQTWIQNYLTTPALAQCSNWSRLHTEQCVAAGHYKYEDAFCVAEHQLTDTSECLTKARF